MPAFSATKMPGPLAIVLVERNALKSTPLPAVRLPPVTVQLNSGMDPEGNAVTPDTYKHPVQVKDATLPAVKLPELSI